jgi:hypothetical protein
MRGQRLIHAAAQIRHQNQQRLGSLKTVSESGPRHPPKAIQNKSSFGRNTTAGKASLSHPMAFP